MRIVWLALAAASLAALGNPVRADESPAVPTIQALLDAQAAVTGSPAPSAPAAPAGVVNPFAGFASVVTGSLPTAVEAVEALEESAAGEAPEEGEPPEELDLSDFNTQPPLVPREPETPSMDSLVGLKYDDMDVEEILSQYSDWTGLALMRAPDVPSVKITLKCPKRLPKREALLAIEGVLAMHGIALVPMGTNFLKVVQIGAARQQGMATSSAPLEQEIEDTDRLVSRIVELKHLEIAEAQATIQNLLHPYGKIIPLERVNCLLITESALNLKRILEILAIIDQPLGAREELRIFPVQHAKASEIQAKIEAIIADVQTTAETAARTTRRRFPLQPFQPIQPGQPAPGQPGETPSAPTLDRSLIKSKVKMVSDDRINSLIIITHPDQLTFFTDIIAALDKKVEPEVSIKVFALEYADAKDVVSVLNDLIGAASKAASRDTAPAAPGAVRRTPLAPPAAPAVPAPRTETDRGGEIELSGKLSGDVKIIADERINSLLVMASRADMAAIEDIVRQIDIMLSQVLIEVVIVEIGLTDKIKVGIDWLQRSMIAYTEKQGGGRRAFLGFGGASRAGTAGALTDGSGIDSIARLPAGAGSGLSYYFNFFDYNLDMVVNMLASSSEAQILSTPIILTTDNKEAKIIVGEKRPVVTATSLSGTYSQSSYEYVNIGIELEVTPRINKKGFVVMDIKQKIDNKGEDVVIDGNAVPVITTRDFTASIAVYDGRTIVIGGIVSSDAAKSRTKIPFLGDIPLLGALFRSSDNDVTRRELIVLMTPYVLNTPERAYAETARRHGALSEASNVWTRGWSSSVLAAPSPEERASGREAIPAHSYKSREIETDAPQAPKAPGT